MKYDAFTPADQARIIHSLAHDPKWQGTRCAAQVRFAKVGHHIEYAVRKPGGFWHSGKAATVAEAIRDCNTLIHARSAGRHPDQAADPGLFDGDGSIGVASNGRIP